MRALDIYLMILLSSSYGIILDRAINAPGHGKNFFYGLYAMDKRYLEGKMEPIGKLKINDTSNIVIIPSALKDASIKISDQCIHIINNKDRLNRLKGSSKMQNIESLLKYQSRI